jgi:hypothetical protein
VSAAWLLVLVLAVAGCSASLDAEVRTTSALQAAGYQGIGMTVDYGSEFPPNGLIILSYSARLAGNEQGDARHAEEIVWGSYSHIFGELKLYEQSGPRYILLAHLTYAQLAAAFGPRSQGLENASAATAHARTVKTAIELLTAFFASGAIALIVVMRSRRRRPPGAPPGPPPGWPSAPPDQVL